MYTKNKSIFALALVAALIAGVYAEVAAAQDLHPSRRPSPMGMARTILGDSYISVVYSRPYKRDRENIFGTKEAEALVPYGEIWRTGANEATQITITKDVTVAGKPLAAGTYTLFTTPGEKQWQVHFNSKLGMWGTYGPGADGKFGPAFDADLNVLSVTVDASQLEEEVEQLTLAMKDTEGGSDLVLQWLNTEVRVPFGVSH